MIGHPSTQLKMLIRHGMVWYKHITSTSNIHAPIITKRVKGKPAPWLNDHIKGQMNDRDRLLRKKRKTKTDFDKNAYRLKQNHVNIILRNAKSSYHQKLIERKFK